MSFIGLIWLNLDSTVEAQQMELALEAILGQRSAHSFATGPAFGGLILDRKGWEHKLKEKIRKNKKGWRLDHYKIDIIMSLWGGSGTLAHLWWQTPSSRPCCWRSLQHCLRSRWTGHPSFWRSSSVWWWRRASPSSWARAFPSSRSTGPGRQGFTSWSFGN